jgi:putative Holliday junction resolvase
VGTDKPGAPGPSSLPGTAAGGEVRPQRGAVLALDFGERRMGVAVGELELGFAHPLATLSAGSDRERLDALEGLVKEWAPVLFVVGLPVHLDGNPHPLAVRCQRFAAKLRARFGRPTRMVDERLTSATASLALAEAGVRGRRQKAVLDQMAAQQILQAFFSSPDDPA